MLFTLIYVVPFYFSTKTRPSLHLPRDAPESIRARVRSVTFSTLVCFAITAYVLSKYGEASSETVLKPCGLWQVSLIDTAKTVLLVSILYAGPLFEEGIVEGNLKGWLRGSALTEAFGTWQGFRTLVVVRKLFWDFTEPELIQYRDP